ncbi:hypothetical protein HDU93_001350 [Gonapodya sp. JEL0774]|nr:hypothetical protein HDU93_001350 [Gonapodya sp. JEL0774]
MELGDLVQRAGDDALALVVYARANTEAAMIKVVSALLDRRLYKRVVSVLSAANIDPSCLRAHAALLATTSHAEANRFVGLMVDVVFGWYVTPVCEGAGLDGHKVLNMVREKGSDATRLWLVESGIKRDEEEGRGVVEPRVVLRIGDENDLMPYGGIVFSYTGL